VNEKALAILVLLLANVSNEYDKSVGSFIYDSLASVAIEMAKTDVTIDVVKDMLSIEKLSGSELAQRIRERTGIIRRVATSAIGTVTLTGSGTINTGDLFETPGGIQFQSTETKVIAVSGIVTIQSFIAGASGVVPAGAITLFPVTLAGFTAVTNANPTQDGFEAESDADLLQRYYDRVQTPATSGNKSHYLNWAKEVNGVGLAKVFPLWAGNNTVKIVIIDLNRQPASAELVASTQEYIDPDVAGLGEGAAGIGAFVTVVSATGLVIDVSVTIVLSAGYTALQADANITANLTQYLKDIAFVESIVSYAKVGASILASEGVEDYANLIVNSGTANVPITDEKVAVIGSVTVNVP
jgi:uncharacterized phage protein gp47/JayE